MSVVNCRLPRGVVVLGLLRPKLKSAVFSLLAVCAAAVVVGSGAAGAAGDDLPTYIPFAREKFSAKQGIHHRIATLWPRLASRSLKFKTKMFEEQAHRFIFLANGTLNPPHPKLRERITQKAADNMPCRPSSVNYSEAHFNE